MMTCHSSLNKGQNEIFVAFEKFIESEQQIFTFTGKAGTGKTFLLKLLIELVAKRTPFYKVATPTGKAAAILCKKGIAATTIHKVIYDVVEDLETKETRFERKKQEELDIIRFFFIDEATMVNEEMQEIIEQLNCKIIYSGDTRQLPPVNSSNSIFTRKIDGVLDEIMRQKGDDNQIPFIAEKVSNGESLKVGNYGNVAIRKYSTFNENQLINLFKRADQVLCGRNMTKDRINILMKQDPSNNQIEKGDKVICLANEDSITVDYDLGVTLVNGLSGLCEEVQEVNTKLNINLISFNYEDKHIDVFNAKKDELNEYTIKRATKVVFKDCKYIEYDSNNRIHKMLTTNTVIPFDLAYAISVHKAQGSEWDNVVVIDESGVFREHRYKWLYTAITRAKKNLVVLLK